jgi:hypothetical protein
LDETSFRDARSRLNPQPCPFEKALLLGCCGCSRAIRRSISERETVACSLAEARATCAALRQQLQQNSLFALKLAPGTPIPHAKQMKVACGGLLGLARKLAPGAGRVEVEDVQALVAAALARWGSLDALPYSDIMASVAAFEARRRRA